MTTDTAARTPLVGALLKELRDKEPPKHWYLEVANLARSLEAQLAEATKGPWKTDFKLVGDLLMSYQAGNSTTGSGETVSVASARTADHELVTALVNAWPKLREMARDAERYRWLRDNERAVSGSLFIGFRSANGISQFTDYIADAAIDAAKQETSRG